MHLLTEKNKAQSLAISSINIAQAVLYVPSEEETKKQVSNEKTEEKSKSPYHAFLKKIFPYLQTSTTYTLLDTIEGTNATIAMYLFSESGKININSLYDFRLKKFINEGKDGDRKKFCEWLFEKISTITREPSLFPAFEQFLKKRTTEFNDVTELLAIPEFAKIFNQKVFFKIQKNTSEAIYLTDIFTVSTDTEMMNPWFFSQSWRILLDIKTKKLSKEEQKKLVESFKNKANWETDWNNSLKKIYEKDFQNLPKEIKSLLTTECEANIFSLLLSAAIGETTVTIFTILKKQSTEKSLPFDIVKIYQI